MPIDVLYDNLFLGNWNLQLPLRRLQQTVAIGQLSELSRSSFCELISATTATLAASTSCHQDPYSIQGRQFAAMAAEVCSLYGIIAVVKPREVLAMLGCHLQQPQQRTRFHPWSQALVRIAARSLVSPPCTLGWPMLGQDRVVNLCLASTAERTPSMHADIALS